MKIKKLAIIILMTTIFIILGTKVFAKTGEINSKDVKLRKIDAVIVFKLDRISRSQKDTLYLIE